MPRYIDVDILRGKIVNIISYCQKDKAVGPLNTLNSVLEALIDTPTADVQEVVHGEWMPERAISLKLTAYRCTECRNIYTAMTRYCPACGAKMDGGNKTSTGNETLF